MKITLKRSLEAALTLDGLRKGDVFSLQKDTQTASNVFQVTDINTIQCGSSTTSCVRLQTGGGYVLNKDSEVYKLDVELVVDVVEGVCEDE